ncbi:MAG: peptidase M16 [Flavobacteriaceae bacterium]|nr:peptidase M16 [Flavobacteriaceae bacterium]
MKKMKKIILIITALIFTLNINAQLDRSVMPTGGPSPKIKLDKPKEFKLKNGIKVLVVENHKLPRVNYSLRFDRKPIVEGEKAGVISLLGSMLGNGTTSISKDEFNEEVDFLGASVNVGFGSGFAFTLTKNNERVLDLFSDAVINPLLTEEEFEKEKEKLIEGLKSQKKDIDAISGRVGDALSYGKNHAYGEFITEQTIDNISFQDILDYHAKYFIPNNVYIVVIGDVNYKNVKSLISEKFGTWKKGKNIDDPEPVLTENVALTEINFVDLPTATQSAIQVTNNVDLKMTDEDYFAALMANDILGGGGEGYLFKNLREDKGYTYGAYSSLGSNRYGVSKFRAGAKVRNMVTDSAVSEIVKEISRIRLEKVDSELLKNAKAKYVGSFIRNAENPQTIAGYALNIKLNNLPDDYYESYLENINSVSEADVKKAANKHFKIANTRIVVVGKGSDVVANLEEVGFPINYYDQYANPIAKPIFNKAIPEGLTAVDVINNYISAVGGKSNLESVNTVVMKADVTIPGAPFAPQATMRQKLPNKSSFVIEVNMQGQKMTLSKTTFDGERGYSEMQGQRVEFDEKQLDENKKIKGIFEELYFKPEELELVSINSVNFQDAYKVKVTVDGKESHRYYSVESGLLLSKEDTDDNNNVVTTNYGDYQSVQNVMFPFYMELPAQKLEFKTSSIEINKEIKDSSF